MFVRDTKAVLGLNLELSHSCLASLPIRPSLPSTSLQVVSSLPCFVLGQRRWIVSADGPVLLPQPSEQPHLSSLQHQDIAWKLIFEMEIRTVKGRESWHVDIFRSDQGTPQQNPDRAYVPGMASRRLLFRSSFINFFASFSM